MSKSERPLDTPKDPENGHHLAKAAVDSWKPEAAGKRKRSKKGAEEGRERTQQKITAENSKSDFHTHTHFVAAFLEVTDKLATGCTTMMRMRRSEQLGCREWALHSPPLFWLPPQGWV